jgi:hypothetical protein
MGWFDKFIPKMWDILLDDSMHSTITTIRVTHRHRDQNKILEAIQQIPIVMYAEDVDDESDE